MYDVSTPGYAYKLTEFVKKVSGIFILNGAFCYIDKTKTTAMPAVLTSGGFNYGSVSAVPVGSVTGITDENMIIHFTFYKKYDSTLPEDIHGKIYYEDNQYVLHIANQVTAIDILPHNDFKIRLIQEKPLTVSILREILGKVRDYYLLDKLSKLDDVLAIKSTKTELDEVLSKIKEYLIKVKAKGYLLDMCVKSTTDIIDKKILELFVKNKDGSKAHKELILIELLARKFEPTITLSTMFANSDDKMVGIFEFLTKGEDTYEIAKVITQEEANYFTRGIITILSDLTDYHYVTDVTP